MLSLEFHRNETFFVGTAFERYFRNHQHSIKMRNIENIILGIALGPFQIIRDTFFALLYAFETVFCFCMLVKDISTTSIKLCFVYFKCN